MTRPLVWHDGQESGIELGGVGERDVGERHMTDIESAEEFAVNACMAPRCSGGDKADPCCAVLADLVRKRDAAIRANALEEAAAELDRGDGDPDVAQVTLEKPRGAHLMTWKLSRLSCAARIRALATKGPSR